MSAHGKARLAELLTPDRIAALLFIAATVVYGWQGAKFTAALQADVIGPAFFPKILTGAAVILGVILLFQRGGKKLEEEDRGDRHYIAVLTPLVLLLAYALAFEGLGFPLATVMFLTVCFRFLGQPAWAGAFGWAVGITAVIFVTFQYALDLKLPLGLLKGLL